MLRSAMTGIGLLLLASQISFAETFEVKMLNGNATGGMAFEPDFLRLQPGDRVKFIATQRGHNAASISGFLPQTATPFKGKMNEEIEVSFSETGFYGIKCTPHYDMGMVLLLQVGDVSEETLQLPGDLPKGARRRFDQIIQRAFKKD